MDNRGVFIVVALSLVFLISFVGYGQNSISVLKSTDAVSLDPHDAAAGPSMNVYVNIYESLTKVAPDGTIEPWLAKSWERVDNHTVRFYLRENVKFHNGNKMDAEAVKFTIERAIDPDNPARVAGSLGPISGVEVVDTYTVDVKTSEKYGPVPLSMSYFLAIGIVSPEAVEKYGDDFGRNPVGTGPFKFKSWEPNEEIVLERFEDYWRENAKLQQITYKVVPDPQSRNLTMKRGQADVLLNPQLSQIKNYKKSEDLSVHSTPGLRVMFFGFDTAEGTTSKKEVRKAIAHSIDAKLLTQTILEGNAVPASSFAAPAYFGYRDVKLQEKYSRDLEKVKSIMEEIGWGDKNGDGIFETEKGENVEVQVYAPEGRYPNDKQIATAVGDMLEKAGFSPKLVIDPWSTYISALGKPSLDNGHQSYGMHLVGWASGPDAVQILSPLYETDRMPPESCCNWFYYEDEKVNEKLVRAAGSTDQGQREELYGEAQELLAEDLPSYPFAILNETVVTKDNLKGYDIHPLDFYKGYFYQVELS